MTAEKASGAAASAATDAKTLRCSADRGGPSHLALLQDRLGPVGQETAGPQRLASTWLSAAMARKLAVAVWYLDDGRWTALEEIDARLSLKVGKIISQVGQTALKSLGKTRKQLREEMEQSLRTTRTYVLNPDKKFAPQRPQQTLAGECA